MRGRGAHGTLFSGKIPDTISEPLSKDCGLPVMPNSLRILVVENHQDVLEYLQRYLESVGHTVSIARTVGEAVDLGSAGNFDVLLSDIQLPDGSGLEIPRRLNAKPRLCVAMSGHGSPADRKRSADAGFHHHLTKPFLPREVDALLAGV